MVEMDQFHLITIGPPFSTNLVVVQTHAQCVHFLPDTFFLESLVTLTLAHNISADSANGAHKPHAHTSVL